LSAGLAIANARIVAPGAVIEGGLLVENGLIAEIAPQGRHLGEAALDFEGDYLLPGLVELHTDNLERQFQPRPAVRWPADAAMLAHDQQMAAAGITTVCDAICVGFHADKQERLEFLKTSIDALHHAEAAGTLKAEHLLHLRCEVSDPHVVDLFEPLCREPNLKLVSFMDHTPGQRQWQDLERYRIFHRGRTEASEEEFQALIERRIEEQVLYADRHRRRLLELIAERELTLASHDDTTADHIEQAVAEGMAISEFPTTRAAADAAHVHGMSVLMGAPNVILGGSHSGNVSALELAGAGLLDALSSDYVPVSLLHAAFRLADVARLPLPEAVAMVTRNPAAMIRLGDRGAIAPGLRADLIRVRRTGATPSVVAVWRQGERIG
jgi:alpha-D-ribose 1-methylphosphonate 5-triphosphate diphosphatase